MTSVYEERYVAFIDILGFKGMVNDSVNDEELFDQIRDTVSYIFENKKNNEDEPLGLANVGRMISVFSDSIYLSCDASIAGSGVEILRDAVNLAVNLLWRGFVVRGGIACGKAVHTKEYCFGPAINKAYELESSFAVYPRILVDDSVRSFAIKNPLQDVEEEAEFDELVRHEQDGLLSLNYLGYGKVFDDNNEYYLSLCKIRDILIKNLRRHKDDKKIYVKYSYLLDYYHGVIKQVGEFDDLKITTRDIAPSNGEKDIRVEAYGKDFSYLENLAYETEKMCIYGAGVNGEIICKYLGNLNIDIEFFVDCQAEDREFTVLGKSVIAPKTLFDKYPDIKVIATPDNQIPVMNYLIENGVREENLISPFKRIVKDIRVLGKDYNPNNYIAKHKSIQCNPDDAKATIFTILYNTPAEFLCRTIESVLKQTYKNFLYLIIDNGSTDGSAGIIKQYADADERIKYIRLESNVVWADKVLLRTLGENINTDYAAMLDSDDYYEPEFLEKTIRCAKEHDAQIVQVNTLTYAHEGFRYSYFTHWIGRDICVEGSKKEAYLLMRLLFVPVWGKLYRTDLLKKLIQMMLSYESGEERDRNFCLDISWITYMALECGRAVLCDEVLHVRTWRPGSSEHSDDHSSKWLSSIIWSFKHLNERGIKYEEAQVFEESQLMWLFSLPREKFGLDHFRESDLNYPRVQEFLKRPVCDKFRG